MDRPLELKATHVEGVPAIKAHLPIDPEDNIDSRCAALVNAVEDMLPEEPPRLLLLDLGDGAKDPATVEYVANRLRDDFWTVAVLVPAYQVAVTNSPQADYAIGELITWREPQLLPVSVN